MQYTYNTLFASCQNYCTDMSTAAVPQSYATEFPFFVQLAETMIIKDLNLAVFDTTTVPGLTLTLGNQNLVKPADYIDIQDFFIFVNGSRKYLQPRSKSWLDDYWRNYTNVAEPAYYAENTTSQWQVAPTPDQNYVYQVNYIARPLPMTATNQTTYIGDKLGEVLLPAVLIFSWAYLREDPTSEQGVTKVWEDLYTKAITQARTELDPMVSAKDDIVTPIVTMGG